MAVGLPDEIFRLRKHLFDVRCRDHVFHAIINLDSLVECVEQPPVKPGIEKLSYYEVLAKRGMDTAMLSKAQTFSFNRAWAA